MIIGLAGQAGSGKDTVADVMVRDHGFCKVAIADPFKRFVAEVFQFSDEQMWGPSEKRNEPDKRYRRCGGEGRYCGNPLRCAQCGSPYGGPHNEYLTPRYALQQLGSEWGRACYENVWIDYALRVADKLLHGSRDDPNYHNYYSPKSGLIFVGGYDRPKGVVISDVRWPMGNEGTAIRKKGGQLVYIHNDGAGLSDDAGGKHESERETRETPWSFYDYVLDNTILEDREQSLSQLSWKVANMLGGLRHKK